MADVIRSEFDAANELAQDRSRTTVANMLLRLISPAVPTGADLSAILIVICFSAGLNVYATVAMLGFLARGNMLSLPPSLHLVTNWYVIGICCALFLVEFIGDKIPVFDLLWNAAHTFVRVPVAALIAYEATAALPEWERLGATLIGGLIAFAAHGGKMAARTAVTPSPEPLSNAALSLGEDGIVIFLTWLATKHPYAAAAITIVALAIIVIMIRLVIRALRALFGGAENALSRSSPPASAA